MAKQTRALPTGGVPSERRLEACTPSSATVVSTTSTYENTFLIFGPLGPSFHTLPAFQQMGISVCLRIIPNTRCASFAPSSSAQSHPCVYSLHAFSRLQLPARLVRGIDA